MYNQHPPLYNKVEEEKEDYYYADSYLRWPSAWEEKSHHRHHHHWHRRHRRRRVLQDTYPQDLFVNSNNNNNNDKNDTLSSSDFITNDPLSVFGVPPVNETDPMQAVQNIVELSFCKVQVSRDLYQPPPFHSSRPLERSNSWALRFGGSNDMITLLDNNDDNNNKADNDDYILGLLSTSIVIGFFFTGFTILIVMFMVIGYKRVGFLSGRFVRPRQQRRRRNESTPLWPSNQAARDPRYDRKQEDQEQEYNESYNFNNTQDECRDVNRQHHPHNKNKNNNIEKSDEWYNDHVHLGQVDEGENESNDNSHDNDWLLVLKEQDELDERQQVYYDENEDDGEEKKMEDHEMMNDGHSNGNDRSSPTPPTISTMTTTTPNYGRDPCSFDDDDDNDDHSHNMNKDSGWYSNENKDVWVNWYRYQQEKRDREQIQRLFRTRIAFVCATIGIIVSCFLFCVYGTNYVNRTLVTVQDGLHHVQKLCRGAISLIDNYMERQEVLVNMTRIEINTLNGIICPKAFTSLCTSLDPIENCDFDQMPDIVLGLRQGFQSFFQALYQRTSSYILDELSKVRADLQDLVDTLDEYVHAEAQLEWAFWISFGFTVAICVLCGLNIFCIAVSHYQEQQRQGRTVFWTTLKCVQRRFLYPIFLVFVMIALVFCLVFVIAAVAASDFCIHSPDGKVTAVLDNNKDQLSSIIYQFATFYVNQCDASLSPLRFVQQSNSTLGILEVVGTFLNTLNSIDETEWNEQCGTDISVIQIAVRTVERSLCLLSLTLEDINRFMWCRVWSPTYTLFMHEAICYDAQQGLAWVAGTMLFIVAFSYVTLLLRAAVFGIVDEKERRSSKYDEFCESVIRCCCSCR